MLIKEKIGNINSFEIDNRIVEWLEIEWYEANKRILHKKTGSGKEIVMKFLKENQYLTQGDIIFADEHTIIAINIIECEVMIIRPGTLFEMAAVAYEIGNRHLPLFYQDDELLVAYEGPLFYSLQAGSYSVETGKRRLINSLKTTVSPHGFTGSESLFSKIMKRTKV